MKNTWIILVAIAAVAFLLASCSGGGGLGAEQSAGPFKVTLSTTPNPPVAGMTQLAVRVTRSGSPVSGASVKVDSSMPSMNMPGPSLDLVASGDSYGATLNLMAGEWKFVVTVTEGADSGSATYTFEAS